MRRSPGRCSVRVHEDRDSDRDRDRLSSGLTLLELALGQGESAYCKDRSKKSGGVHCSAVKKLESDECVVVLCLVFENLGRYIYCKGQFGIVEICRKRKFRMEVKTSSQYCHCRRCDGEKLTY